MRCKTRIVYTGQHNQRDLDRPTLDVLACRPQHCALCSRLPLPSPAFHPFYYCIDSTETSFCIKIYCTRNENRIAQYKNIKNKYRTVSDQRLGSHKSSPSTSIFLPIPRLLAATKSSFSLTPTVGFS